MRNEGVLSFAMVVKVAIFGAKGGNPSVLTAEKFASIKRVDISQAESNKIKACALPSIHLPLTREARVMVLFRGIVRF